MKKEEIIKKIVKDLPMPCLRDGMTDSEWYGWFEEAYNKGEEQGKKFTLSVVSKWVAVEEKLPLKDGDYIVFEDGVVFEACYYKEKNIWIDYEVTTYKDVTHWKELPKPPCC